jgi:hypothetical protein
MWRRDFPGIEVLWQALPASVARGAFSRQRIGGSEKSIARTAQTMWQGRPERHI